MRILLFGTGDFGIPVLENLVKDGHNLTLVTNPAKPKGRGLKEEISLINKIALEKNVPVISEYNIRTPAFELQLQELDIELMVVVDYGKIIPSHLITLPSLRAINIHPSLLPLYRGATPIQSALINAEKRTGVSIQTLAAEVDAGDILLQQDMAVEESDNYATLEHKLKIIAVDLMREFLLDPNRQGDHQNTKEITNCSKISKQDCIISWNMKAQEIHQRIKAFHPPQPGMRTSFRQKNIKFLSSVVKDLSLVDSAPKEPGMIVEVKKDELLISTGSGVLSVRELQPENRKNMRVSDFINGYRPLLGEKFGESHA